MKTAMTRGLAACLLLGLAVCAGPAQEAKDDAKKPVEPIHVIPFWNTTRGDEVRAAVAVVGMGSPLGSLAMRVGISENVPTIAGYPFLFDSVLPLPENDLTAIRDDRPWPVLTDRHHSALRGPDKAIYHTLNRAIELSHRATPEMFENSAAEHKDVTYTDLASMPKRYRGKVVTIKGKMPVLRKVEAPRLVYDADFITHCYLGWVIGPTKGAPPYCVLFTELPKDVKGPSEEFNRDVTFQGYFIAHVRFPADKERGVTEKDMVAPYLVGKTITVHGKAAAAPERVEQSFDLVVYAVVGIGALLTALIVLNIWLRRGDAKTQEQLERVRAKNTLLNLEPSEPDDAQEAH